jgi:hypothetical protein
MTRWSLLFVLSTLLVFSACRKEEQLNSDSSITLGFSKDTVIFDTVFTTLGSATRVLKIYNTSNSAVSVASIILDQGDQSSFRVNVNGVPGVAFSDVELLGNDSLFIFVEVTIDPNNSNSPLIEEDELVFLTNGNEQRVKLVAWGQDAHFYYSTNQLNGLPDFTALDGDYFNGAPPITETWIADKPYVIYGYLMIDSLDHLTIDPGVQVHFHDGSGLWVLNHGQITVNGTLENPVVFQHDRLEPLYDDLPGQWDLIRVNEGFAGSDNVFTHAIIKNSLLGIQASPLTLSENDLLKPTSENKLILNNCKISQSSALNLYVRNYRVEAKNCLFANAGQYTCGITGGGEFDFQHCTFGNYWVFGTRTTPSFYMSNAYEDELGNLQSRQIESFSARNCVMYGNTFEEFFVEFDTFQDQSNISFSHCLVRVDEMDITPLIFQNMFSNVAVGPGFVSPTDNDFHLIENSYCRDRGDNSLVLGVDLDEALRDASPDLGCYEYHE